MRTQPRIGRLETGATRLCLSAISPPPFAFSRPSGGNFARADRITAGGISTVPVELLRGADGVHNSSAASRPFWGIRSIGHISLDLKSRGKNCQENCQEKRVVEGSRDLPRLVDFLSKSAIFASFIEQNQPIPTTGSSTFSPVFSGFLPRFSPLSSPSDRKTVRKTHEEDPCGRPSCPVFLRIAPGLRAEGPGIGPMNSMAIRP